MCVRNRPTDSEMETTRENAKVGFRSRSLIVTIRDLLACLTLSIPTPLSFHLLIDKLSAQSPRQFLCPLSKPPKRSRPKTQRLAAQDYSSNVTAEPDGGTNITNSSVELNTGNNRAPAPASEQSPMGTPVFQTAELNTGSHRVTAPTSEPSQTGTPAFQTAELNTGSHRVTDPTSEQSQTETPVFQTAELNTGSHRVTAPTSEQSQTGTSVFQTAEPNTGSRRVASPTSEQRQKRTPTL